MNVPIIDAWSLHCLVVLVSERSVTRAGAVLGLSQPATSATLARLRATFADDLLVKSSGGMIPTPRALALASQAQKMLREMREMTAPDGAPFDPANFDGEITLAATDVVRILMLPQMLRGLASDSPGMVIKVNHADRTRIHERLASGDIDLGFGPREVPSGRLHFRELWSDEAVCLACKGWRDTITPLTLEEFLKAGHIRLVPSQPSHYDGLLDRALHAIGRSRKVKVHEPGFLMLPALIQATGLVATVPRRYALRVCEDPAFEYFPLPLDLGPMVIGLYWHERTHREPLFRWLRDRISAITATTASAADR
jgi:DNA-binding transcriptional LysR family regulator